MSGLGGPISGAGMIQSQVSIARDSLSSYSNPLDDFRAKVIGERYNSMECFHLSQVPTSDVSVSGETPSSTLSSASTQDLALAHRAEILEQRQKKMRFG